MQKGLGSESLFVSQFMNLKMFTMEVDLVNTEVLCQKKCPEKIHLRKLPLDSERGSPKEQAFIGRIKLTTALIIMVLTSKYYQSSRNPLMHNHLT